MWPTEEWGKKMECLACLSVWGRVVSRSSETDLPVQQLIFLQLGKARKAGPSHRSDQGRK